MNKGMVLQRSEWKFLGIFMFMCALSVVSARAVDTTISGGRMELLNKGDKVLFTGGVELNRGADKVLANKMTTNKKRDRVRVEGNVRLYRKISSTETWEGTGASGFYNTVHGSGYLEGAKGVKAHIVHTEILSSTSTRIVHIYADRIDFSRAPQSATATGRVEGKTVDPQTGDHFDFWAEHAFFDGTTKELTLDGTPQPVVIQTLVDGRRVLKGDKIVYFNETQHMTSEGNAEAVFEDAKGEKKQ
jgi:lipopolysaccharide export system protein LptA